MENEVGTTQGSDLSDWLSTYGLITVEKILERYHIRLSVDDLRRAVKNPDCLFFRLIQVPLKHSLNGLILQQAKDYQIYAQKLFIDYLLSGESSQEGSQVRDDLEETRKELVAMGEVFNEKDLANDRLIAKSQMLLIKTGKLFHQHVLMSEKKIRQALQQSGVMIHDHQLIIKCLYTLISDYTSKTRLSDQHDAWLRVKNILGQPYDLLLCQLMRDEAEKLNQIDSDTINELQNFSDQALMNTSDFKKFRTDFSAIIVRTNELLTTVGGYHLDVQQLAVNQLDLYFDAKIGEKS